MITMSLGLGVALSDGRGWTPLKKALVLGWMVMLDTAITAFVLVS